MEQANGMSLGGMQRNQVGDPVSQIQMRIMTDLNRSAPTLPHGWQQTHDIRDRANRTLQLITQLRFLQPDVAKCLSIAQSFESKSLLESPTKEIYVETMKHKMDEITAKRRNMVNAGAQPGAMGMPMAPNMLMMANGMNSMHNLGQQNAMNGFGNGMVGMPGMAMNTGHTPMPNMQMPGVEGQQNFPNQLQRPVQPSQIQQQIMAQQDPSNTIDPSAIHGTQSQLQAANMAHSVSQHNPAQLMDEPSQQEVFAVAHEMARRTTEETKQALRNQLLAGLSEQSRGARNDPLPRFFLQKAREHLVKRNTQAPQSGPAAAHAQMNNVQRAQQQMGNSASIDFTSILGQQANGLKSQESGEQVVPASNNPAFNLNGSHGMNPQLLGNQANQQPANPQVGNQMQFLMMQQEKQQRMQRQNMLAHQQAMAQQQATQLRGQPGGLNAPNVLNGGATPQLSSPAMSMLNRAMAPPGQNTPAGQQQHNTQPPHAQPTQATQQTQHQPPQQNRTQMMGHTAPNQTGQMPQQSQHQQLMNQNQAKGSNPQQQQQAQRMMQLMQSLPPPVRERINGLPPQQAQDFLMKYQAAKQQAALNRQQNGQHMMQNDASLHNAQNSQPNTFPGGPPEMANPLSAFKPLPQGQQPGRAEQPAVMHQRLQQQQQAQMKQRAMDIATFPRVILEQLQISNMIPPNISNWGGLKDYVRQNQAMIGPGTLEKIANAQSQWFAAHPADLNTWLLTLRNLLAQQQTNKQNQVQNPSPSLLMTPNAQAPHAQMVAPNAPMQPTNGGPGQGMSGINGPGRIPAIQPPTQQEVQMQRDRLAPNAQHISDDQLRQAIWKRKLDQHNKMIQAQMLQQPQPQQHQQQPPPPPPLHQQQQQQSASRNAKLQQTQNIALQNTNAGQGISNPATVDSSGHQQGLKRPQDTSDDVIEIAHPSVMTMGPPSNQSFALQNNFAPQVDLPKGFPTQDQLEKMPVQHRQVYLNHLAQLQQRGQGAIGVSNKNEVPLPANMQLQRLQSLAQSQRTGPGQTENVSPANMQEAELKQKVHAMYNEVIQNTPKGPAVQLDPAGIAQAKTALKKLWPPLHRVQDTFVLALRAPGIFDDARIRAAMKAKVQIFQNIADKEGNIKDYLSLTLAQLREIEISVITYFRDMKLLKDRLDQAKAQTQGNQASAPAVGSDPTPQVQTQSKSAQATSQDMTRTASQQNAVRKALTSSKAPPAPTDNKSFEWHVPSPHGVPKYHASGTELPQDKLKMPAQKKRRTGQAESPASIPVGQASAAPASNSSPPMGGPRTMNAEQIRKQQQQLLQQQQQQQQLQQQQAAQEAESLKEKETNMFKCKDMVCDANIKGFATEEELKMHMSIMHQPVSDPLTFMLEKAAAACGVTVDVNESTDPQIGHSTPKKVSASNSLSKRQDNALAMKRETSTSATLGKTSANAQHITKKLDPESGSATGVVTMRDAMLQKMGLDNMIERATETLVLPDPDAFESRIVNPFFATGLSNFQELDDWSQFAEVDNWNLRPGSGFSSSPTLGENTPESSNTSDISVSESLRINFSWDAFGNGDTCVPDSAQLQALGFNDLKLSSRGNSQMGVSSHAVDAAVTDANVAGLNRNENSNDSLWDWSMDEITDFEDPTNINN